MTYRLRYFAVTLLALLAMILTLGSGVLTPQKAHADGGYGAYGPNARNIYSFVFSCYPRHAHIYHTSGHDGQHASGSYHYRDMAVDFGSASQLEKDRFGAWLRQFRPYETEGIHTSVTRGLPSLYVKYGQFVGPYGPASTHVNHIHLAMSASQVRGAVAKAHSLGFCGGGAAKPAPVVGKSFPLAFHNYYGINDGRLNSHSGVRAADRPAVLKIQAKVRAASGYPKGDAKFGPNTRYHVWKWQKAHHLTPDGKVGPVTWKAMFG